MAGKTGVKKAIREAVAAGGAPGLGDALSGMTAEELVVLRVQVDAALMNAREDREQEDSERKRALREVASVGEALVYEKINCGRCRRCGYAEKGERTSERPHGPYPYLWRWGRGGKISKTYVKQGQVEAVEKRIAAKKEKACLAREELRRTRRGAAVDPGAVEEIAGMAVPDASEVPREVREELDRIVQADQDRDREQAQGTPSGRMPGRFGGRLMAREDFDEPLPEEELAAFEGEAEPTG